jgi:Kdo2-lipid IVA lauroyltransferase/acyltransferase
MQALIFFISYPFIWLISRLPFPLFYAFSDLFHFILYHVAGYRKKVVRQNLLNSFPEKTEAERSAIEKEFYSYLCDLMLETIRTLSMPAKDYVKRVKLNNPELIETLHKEKGSIIVVMGHYGNWEWAGPCFTLNTSYQLNVIYKPLSNPWFERMTYRMRTRFGTRITAVNNVLRQLVSSRGEKQAVAIIADQTPLPEQAYWTEFMHQDTPVFYGTEKIARKFNYPVVYICIDRKRRGYYEINPELLVAEPKSTKEGEITELHTRRLEQDIRRKPELWLWSHRRWKHRKKTSGNLIINDPTD